MTIRLLIVDDHPLVRAGLASLASDAPELEVVGEAGDGRAALEQAELVRPHVVLMDLSMPGMDGIEATRRLTAAMPVAVVVLTSFPDHDRVTAALAAGAVGYLLKDSDGETLLRGIQDAAAGHMPIDARVARALLPGARPDLASTPDHSAGAATHDDLPLTERELQVLRLIATGMANKQIGRALGISEGTVKAHVGSIFKAIGVADRTSAAMWARTRNLV